MSKKKLNVDAVLNELSGKSSYFRRGQSPILEEKRIDKINDQSTARPVERPTGRSGDEIADKHKRKGRITRRYSFEAFLDQIEELKKISLNAAIKGDTVHVSVMIREAIDVYLRSKRERNNKENLE